jgi:oligopeptide transport system ATP-binding protein
MEERKVLLSIKDLDVKFRVRGRILTAIRGISLDIYENESIAIVGESGSGKSVFTKTFAGMLDSNGYIDNGSIIFSDDELADTVVKLDAGARSLMDRARRKLDEYSRLELGAATYRKILELESEKKEKSGLSSAEQEAQEAELKELQHQRTELYNLKQTYDPAKEKDKIRAAAKSIKEYDAKIKELNKRNEQLAKEKKHSVSVDAEYMKRYEDEHARLQAQYEGEIKGEVSQEALKRNEILAKEIYLSVGRYGLKKRHQYANQLLKALKKAMELGVDLSDDAQRNAVFDNVTFRVQYLDETPEQLHGTCILNLANVKYSKDWSKIRGRRIATVFQDPMTSLNPIITIGKQITSVILKHQDCSEMEARNRALDLMNKVGIPNAAARFDDYPFQYSGGMRQRIVIAIALSCQPKILICDEPTTALDVTIQAQILKLIKDLQREFNYTIVFITHDLGVVANIADRVAVLYAGQIIELGKVDEVFYDPRHPYTWALLSSLPQLAQKNTKLYSITGTPPSLYNQIVGDAFAPRNPYCLEIDTLLEPPMFQVTETHFAKTWLLDPRAPKLEKPEGIQDIHEKLMAAFNI